MQEERDLKFFRGAPRRLQLSACQHAHVRPGKSHQKGNAELSLKIEIASVLTKAEKPCNTHDIRKNTQKDTASRKLVLC